MKGGQQVKISLYFRTVLVLICMIAGLLVTCLIPDLCDKYTDKIYVVLCDKISKITGSLRINLGEIIMYLIFLSLFLILIFLILLIFLRKKAGYKRFFKNYLKTIFILGLFFVVIYMFSWAVPFSGKTLGGKTFSERKSYTSDEAVELLNKIVEKINKAADEIEVKELKTASGKSYAVNFRNEEENRELIIEALKDISDEYPRLKGYYPPVKSAYCSDLLDIMDIGGFNYPYTMEPTHNKYLDPLYQPLLDAHEYVHHKGYYKENEGCFISELALAKSKDPYFRLIAYLDMYYNILDSYYEIYQTYPDGLLSLSEKVNMIIKASNNELEKIYKEDSHPFSSNETIQKAVDDIGEKGWRIQDEILKENSYSGVTLLLFQYYYEGYLF